MLVSQAAALLNHEDGLELQQMPVSTSGIWFQASWRSGQFHCKCLGAHRAGEPDEAAVAWLIGRGSLSACLFSFFKQMNFFFF